MVTTVSVLAVLRVSSVLNTQNCNLEDALTYFALPNFTEHKLLLSTEFIFCKNQSNPTIPNQNPLEKIYCFFVK